jgi:hypothetical protein
LSSTAATTGSGAPPERAVERGLAGGIGHY